jgi:hypothetical protein
LEQPLDRRRFLVAYGAWVFLIFAYFLPGATWNPVSRFDLTRAIVERGTLTIDGLEDSTGDRAYRGGHWYTDKAPIGSLLALPVYAAFHFVDRRAGGSVGFERLGPEGSASRIRVNASFQLGLYACSLGTAALAGAGLAVMRFEVLRKRTSPVGALVSSAAVVLATPVFPYATSFYGHTIAAFFLFVAVATAIGESPSRRAVRVAGACIALAAGSEYLTAVPGLVAAVCLVRSRPRAEARTSIVDLAIGAALPLAVVAAYQTLCFGAPWQTGYSHVANARFAHGHEAGILGVRMPRLVALAGLLAGPRRGLFVVAPATLLGTIGLVCAAWSGERASRVALGAAATMLLLNSGYYMWWGGAAAGPRHLVPVLPLLGFGYAAAWNSSRLRPLLAALATVSFGLLLALTAIGLEAPEHGNVLTRYVIPMISRGRVAQIQGASNLGLLAGLPRLYSLAPLLAFVGLGFWALMRDASRLATRED